MSYIPALCSGSIVANEGKPRFAFASKLGLVVDLKCITRFIREKIFFAIDHKNAWEPHPIYTELRSFLQFTLNGAVFFF